MKKFDFKNEKYNKNATNFGSFFAMFKDGNHSVLCGNSPLKNQIFKSVVAFFLILSLLLTLVGCNSATSYSDSRVYSFGDVSLTAYNLSEEEFASAFEEICLIAESFESTVSLSNEGSELSVVNESEQIEISDLLKEQIEIALEYYDKTNGDFNILLASIVSAWGFLPGEENYLAGEIPSAEYLESLRYTTDISQIELSENTLTKPEYITIDLGGISKGYMADKMTEILENYSADAILTVGGIIVATGDKLGDGYNVAITDPFGSGYFCVVSIGNTTIVTSGNYERYFEVDGEIYCHIIDPETLSPTTSDVASVSALAESAVEADIFATALMIADSEEREQMIEENNLSVLLIYSNGESEIFGDFPVS